MTLGVIEPKTSAIICPALEVTSGQKTFEAANKEYNGLKLPCIHCWEELRRNGTRWLERGLVEAVEEEVSQQTPLEYQMPQSSQEVWAEYRQDDAGLIRNLVAKGFRSALGVDLPIEYDVATEKIIRTAVDASFRRGFFNPTTGKRRWMHFTHGTGRLKGTSQFSCHDPSGIDHQVAVGSFKLKLEKNYQARSDINIVLEKTIICKPGEPPETRRPDLVVYQSNKILKVLEVQRSFISLKSIQERTQNLRAVCDQIEWYFSKGIYNRMSMHEQRKWLSDSGISFFYYWYDEKTGKLQYSEGKRPEYKNHRSGSRFSTNLGSDILDCKHFDPLDSATEAWNKNPEKLTISMLGAAVYQKEDRADSEILETNRKESAKNFSLPPAQICVDFSPLDENLNIDSYFSNQSDSAKDFQVDAIKDKRSGSFDLEAYSLSKDPELLEAAEINVGGCVQVFLDGVWHEAELVHAPNNHPDPTRRFSGWKVALTSGELHYIWDSKRIKLMH